MVKKHDRIVEFEWPEAKITLHARLSDEKNPKRNDFVWDVVLKEPKKAVWVHSLTTGESIYCGWKTVKGPFIPAETIEYYRHDPKTKYVLTKYVGKVPIKPGSLTIEPSGVTQLFYGRVAETFDYAESGAIIPEDLEKTRRIGDLIWGGQLTGNYSIAKGIIRRGV